jgi:hypothetical protein
MANKDLTISTSPKASSVGVINVNGFIPSAGQITSPKNTSLVRDPYGNKYYGNTSFKDFQKNLSQAVTHYSNIISKSHMTMTGNSGEQRSVSMLGIQEAPNVTARNALANIASIKNSVKEEDYVHREQVVESFGKYGDNWNKYFEGNYKNPRLNEANQGIISRNKNPLTIQSTGAIPSKSNGVRKIVGTGLSGTTSNNPFGSLDAGLNI